MAKQIVQLGFVVQALIGIRDDETDIIERVPPIGPFEVHAGKLGAWEGDVWQAELAQARAALAQREADLAALTEAEPKPPRAQRRSNPKKAGAVKKAATRR